MYYADLRNYFSIFNTFYNFLVKTRRAYITLLFQTFFWKTTVAKVVFTTSNRYILIPRFTIIISKGILFPQPVLFPKCHVFVPKDLLPPVLNRCIFTVSPQALVLGLPPFIVFRPSPVLYLSNNLFV